MAILHPPFASSEYVERWLSDIQSKPCADEQTSFRDCRLSKRKWAGSPNKNLESRTYASPHKRRKRAAIRRSKSSKPERARSIEGNWNGDGNQNQRSSSSSSSNFPAEFHVQSCVSNTPGSQKLALEDPSKKYLRRPRHRLKVDTYEYKGDVVNKSPAKKAMKTKQKRSRHNKTGNALNQEFNASNVEVERLTLKANARPGIFGKGKASTLLQTRGLPDLTFSEMNFLSKKRQPDHLQNDKQKQSKPAKKIDKSKEISEFFAKPRREMAKPRRSSSETHPHRSPIDLTGLSNSSAILSPAKLPSRMSFSLVSESKHGARSRSRQTKQVLPPASSDMTDKITNINQSHRSDILAAKLASKPVETAPASCSWSVTPSRQGSRHRAANVPEDTELIPALSTQPPKASLICESPITNSSLDRYTKQLLLDRDHDLWQNSYRAPLGPTILSLDDLKSLAQIAEIEQRYSGLPGMLSPPRRTFEREYTSQAPVPSTAYGVRSEYAHGKHPVTSQLRKGSFIVMPTNQNLPAMRELLPSPSLRARDHEPYNILPRKVAPEGLTSAHLNAHIDHAQHHNRPCSLFERHEQDLFNEQKLSFYRDTVHGTLEPKTSMRPNAGDLGADELIANDMQLNHDITELRGLHYGENMEDDFEGHEYGLELHSVDYDNGKPSLRMDGTIHDSGWGNRWDRGGGVSIRNRRSALYAAERPEEGFSGFSRPQILY